MNEELKARLEAGGFRETNVAELFGLAPEETELVETRLALSRLLRQLRQGQSLAQRKPTLFVDDAGLP